MVLSEEGNRPGTRVHLVVGPQQVELIPRLMSRRGSSSASALAARCPSADSYPTTIYGSISLRTSRIRENFLLFTRVYCEYFSERIVREIALNICRFRFEPYCDADRDGADPQAQSAQ